MTDDTPRTMTFRAALRAAEQVVISICNDNGGFAIRTSKAAIREQDPSFFDGMPDAEEWSDGDWVAESDEGFRRWSFDGETLEIG